MIRINDVHAHALTNAYQAALSSDGCSAHSRTYPPPRTLVRPSLRRHTQITMRPKEAHDVLLENVFNVIGILRAQHDPGVNGPGAAPHEVRQVTRSAVSIHRL